jgi:hypothetical protein
VHQINHEARINPDLFAAGRLTMHACIKRRQCHDIRRPRCGGLRCGVRASTTQWLLSLTTPADVAGVAQRGGRRLSGASLSAAAR